MKVQLRTHSDLSIINGIIPADQIPKIAKERGYECVALTDFMNMFGFVKFYKNCLKQDIKPILGVELLLNNENFGDYKILMLAKNNTGLINVFELITNAYIKYKDLFLGEIKIPDDFILSKKNKINNVFILSGGIYSDYVNLMQKDNFSLIEERMNLWGEIYGDDYFVELNKVQTKKYPINNLNKLIYKMAKEKNIKVVATHPIYFKDEEDYIPHQIKKCNVEKTKLDKNSIESLDQEYTYDMFFISSDKFQERFDEIKEEITENLTYIKNNCNVELRLGMADLPNFPIPENETIENYFRNLSIKGLENRLKEIFPNKNDYEANKLEYFNRLNYELDTIIQMKFPGYFLIVADFINWAKENDIPVGAGRGSGAGSLVAYSLKITDLNPIPYDLLFERFLNPERVSMPDFDIDFCQEKRGLVIDYVTNKYGKECVSQIATFGTMASKAVLNDVVRVLNYPYNLGASLTKRIPFGYSLEGAYNEDSDLQNLADKDEEVKEIWDNALKLEGLARSIGKHAAGVVIAPSKISDYCPLYQADGNQTSQLDKVDVEDVGLVKFDFLGLKNLTIIDETLKMIKYHKNIDLVLDTQKFNDFGTYQILQEGNTTGVFQVESSGMKSYLIKMQPDCFEDIIAMLALYRPGPLGSGMVDDFIKRKRWEKDGKPDPQNTMNFSNKYQVSNYFVPALEDCLKPTYGIIVYQEQVMKISQIIAGYSLGGADLLRRCISGNTKISLLSDTKKIKYIYKNKEKYIGALVNSFNEQTGKMELKKIIDVFHNGFQKTYQLELVSGDKIRATKDHLFLTKEGWKKLSSLNNEDIIAVPNRDIKKKLGKFVKNILHDYFLDKMDDDERILLLNREFLWSKIKNLKEYGFENVYDLSVEDNHNFSANGIIVHNCMGKKKPEEMAQQRSIFLEGAKKNGYTNEIAMHLFDLMESFAEYGFNKSHSAAYAVITYHTAYLKKHYLSYFMSATMSSDMNNLEHLEILVNDAKDNNLKIINPDINKSYYKFYPIDDNNIVYSFGALKGITEQSAKLIVEEREKNGLFKDVNDFFDRCFEFIDKKILLALVCSGCFDSLDVSRKSLFENIDSILKQKKQLQKTKHTASLFENYELSNFVLNLSNDKWNINYQLDKEFDIIGFHLTDNLFKKYNKQKIYNNYLSPSDFKNKDEETLTQIKTKSQYLKICGVVKEHKLGQGAFIVIYDYNHKIKMYFSSSALTTYKIHLEELIPNAFVVLSVYFSFKIVEDELKTSFYIQDILEIK